MSCEDDFVTGRLQPDLLQAASARAAAVPVLRGSHRERHANLIGAIGELVVERWFINRGCTVTSESTVWHDGVVESVRYEVKTKDRTVQPTPDFEATVPAYQYEYQIPAYYMFVSLLRRGDAYTHATIVGAISRERFDACKYFVAAGPKENGAVFFCDAWNVRIRDLDSPALFLVTL